MASFTFPQRGVEYIGYVSLMDASDGTRIKTAPTLAAGDVQISQDGGAFANVTNLPVESPAAGGSLRLTLTAAEMTADNVVVKFSDQTASAEWADMLLNIQPQSEPVDANVTQVDGSPVNADPPQVDVIEVNGNPVVGGTPDVNVISTASAERDALADAHLNRDMSAVSDTNSRSPLNALRALRNRWTSAAGTLTVYEEDDLTVAWTSALASDAGANPVTGSDPA